MPGKRLFLLESIHLLVADTPAGGKSGERPKTIFYKIGSCCLYTYRGEERILPLSLATMEKAGAISERLIRLQVGNLW